jgi:hypothetical protein
LVDFLREGKMTDEQITALMARLRTFVQRNGHNDMAVTTIDTDHARAILAHIDAQAAEIARLREAKWIVRHADTANDMVLMGMARDSAIAERDALATEIARLRDALGFYANLPCRLEFGVVNECTYDDGDTARAALAQETQP